MNKVVLASLTLILARDCALAGPRFHGPIQGTWGGQNAGLMAFDTTAHVHIGCTAGDTKQALVADEQGRFDVPGRYNITLYPVARGPDHPARFIGSTDGVVMTLTVTLTDTAVTLGPVRLVLGGGAADGAVPDLPQAGARSQLDMRALRPTLALFLGALALPAGLRAQERPVHVAAGAGLLFADQGSGDLLRSRGFSAYLRFSWGTFPLLLDASIQSVPQAPSPVFAPCPSPPAACRSAFYGPTTALILAPAIQLTQRVPVATWLFRFGPSMSWFPDREPGSDPVAAGLRAGISVRNGRAQSGLLIAADYFRVFRAGTSPRWLLPVTIGWQF